MMGLRRAALMVLVLQLAACAQMAEMDKGLYGAVNQVGGRDSVTGARTLSLNGRAQNLAQYDAGLDKELAEFKAKGGKLNEAVDPAGYARVKAVAGRLLRVSHFAGDPAPWKIVLLPNAEFNAFTNGGSYIVVYKGLLDAVKNDDELAAVLGHEIGHVAANHVGESSAYTNLALLAGSGSARRDTFQQSFTMGQEGEADRIGILYAALAGYDPHAASRVWSRMYASEGNQTLISNHPLNRDRVASTEAIATKVEGYYTPGKVNPAAQEILTSNTLWSRQGDMLAAGQGGGLAALAETVLNTYVVRENAKQVEQGQLVHAQQVATVKQALQVTGVAADGDDRVRVQLVYRGTKPLSILVLAATSPDGVRAVSHAAPPVQPNQPFVATFDGRGLGRQANRLALGVDDAAF